MKVIFLDRDGVINEYPGDTKYVRNWSEFHFLPGVKEALKRLQDKGFKFFIISNQAGVSKGVYSQRDLDLITENMLRELSRDNIDIAGVYYCTHREEDNCACRKPKIGLIKNALSSLKAKNINLKIDQGYFIGDTIRDVETGMAAGLKTILIFSGKEKAENKENWKTLPDFTASNLSAATELILKI